MRNLFLTIFILCFSSSCTQLVRNPSNIFGRDDRIKLPLKAAPSVGRLFKNRLDLSSWGTAFHISQCHLLSAYHVVKSTDKEMTSNDTAYFLSIKEKGLIAAKPIAWGTPHKGNLNDNDWVILKLEKCISLTKNEIFQLSPYQNVNELRSLKVKLIGFPEDHDPRNVYIDEKCKVGDEPIDPKDGDGIGHNCATRPGNSGSPIFHGSLNSRPIAIAITVSSKGNLQDSISGYFPWIANRATPIAPIRAAFQKLLPIK